MDWKNKTTQMLGRFQPWHKGHTELLKRGLAKTGQVAILLREQDGTDDDPYTFYDRKARILQALSEELGPQDLSRIEIIRVPNITHITYGRDVGYTIEQEHFEKEIEQISGTKIRKKRLLYRIPKNEKEENKES